VRFKKCWRGVCGRSSAPRPGWGSLPRPQTPLSAPRFSEPLRFFFAYGPGGAHKFVGPCSPFGRTAWTLLYNAVLVDSFICMRRDHLWLQTLLKSVDNNHENIAKRRMVYEGFFFWGGRSVYAAFNTAPARLNKMGRNCVALTRNPATEVHCCLTIYSMSSASSA